MQREYAAPIAHDPPAAATCHAQVVIVTSLCLYAATPLPAGGFNKQCGIFEIRFDFRPDPIQGHTRHKRMIIPNLKKCSMTNLEH